MMTTVETSSPQEIIIMPDVSPSLTDASAGPLIGQNVGFERIRRITGYLVGTVERFNNAKHREVLDRQPHVSFSEPARTDEA